MASMVSKPILVISLKPKSRLINKGCFKGISKEFAGFKGISNVFQEDFKGISRKFQGLSFSSCYYGRAQLNTHPYY